MKKYIFMFLFFILMMPPVEAQHKKVFVPGETISYTIKKFGVKMGKAKLVYHGVVPFDKGVAALIVFTAQSLNFYDREEIFCDPQSLRPLRVRRNLNIWGKKEQIVEDYQPERQQVVIKKTAGGKTVVQKIEKAGSLDNIYCFMYRFRKMPPPGPQSVLHLKLPTAEVFLELVKMARIRSAGKVYQAAFMQSRSKEYRLWFGQDEHRTPIRIDGAIGLGSASLIMDDYQITSVLAQERR